MIEKFINFKKRKRILAVIGFLVLVIAFLLIWQLGGINMTGPPSQKVGNLENIEKSIAVLPFKYLSADESKKYLSEGVMDVITSQM